MADTHYWEQPFGKAIPKAKWARIVKRTRAAIEASNVEVQFESDISKPPQLDDDVIRFNGVGEYGHATFYLERSVEKEPWHRDDAKKNLATCKCPGYAYDELVIMTLAIVKSEAPTYITISSDCGVEVFDIL